MLVAIVAERVFIDPLQSRDASVQTVVVALLGIMIVLRYGTGLWFGRFERPLQPPVPSGIIPIGNVVIQNQTVAIYVVTALVFAAFAWFMQRTSLGTSLRVTAIDRIGAQLCGIDPKRVRLVAFAIGGIIAGIVAWLYGPSTQRVV